TIMSDFEHSTVTYTSVSEDDSDMGSPGVEGPIFQDPPSPDYIPGPEGPPSPDYVPGPEEPEQAPPSPIYIPFVPEPVYPEFLPVDDEVFPAEEQPMPAADSPTHQSPGYIPESDPEEDPEEDDEEDPADYPADRGDDDDDTDQDPYLAYRVTARMSIRHQAPAPSTFHELRTRVWLPLRKELCPTTPGLGYEVRESSAAGAARQIGPTTAEADLYDLLIFAGSRPEETDMLLELLKADYRRQRQFARPLKIVREPPGSDDRVYRDNRDLLMSCRARATIGRPVAVLRRSYWLSY
ncbi:hypothetical protein Tco_0883455, partial [Tanacetum coccineum]